MSDNDLRQRFRSLLCHSQSAVKRKYITLLSVEIDEMATAVSLAADGCVEYEVKYRDRGLGTSVVLAYLMNGLNDLVISTNLLVSGYFVASGNMLRQVMESYIMAILVALGEIDMQSLVEGRLRVDRAAQMLSAQSVREKIGTDGSRLLAGIRQRYNECSHAGFTALALGANLHEGKYVVGPSYDASKSHLYKTEMRHRLDAAKTLGMLCWFVGEVSSCFLLTRDD